MPTEIEKWLTKDEKKGYHKGFPYSICDARLLGVLESLAACRASEARTKELMEKHQWVDKYCPECGAWRINGSHKPDCAIAAELEGTEGGE